MKIEFFQKNGYIDEEAIKGGVYLVDLVYGGKRVIHLYVGEAACVVSRCSRHIHEFKSNPSYFGLLEEDTVQDYILRFSLVKSIKVEKKGKRDPLYDNHQIEEIKRLEPVTQVKTGKSDRMLNQTKRIKVVQETMKAYGYKDKC